MAPGSVYFDRQRLAGVERELLQNGRFANARVERVRVDGVDWVLKDFSTRGVLVRNIVGRCLLRREVQALRRLEGLAGVPSQAFRIDAFAMAARYLPGRSLSIVRDEEIGPSYFSALEILLRQVHARGLVHLDNGGRGNLLMQPDGTPGIIDFQSALSTGWMPDMLRRAFEALDLIGIYKKWLRCRPDTLDAPRRRIYERAMRWRRLWVLRGYFGFHRHTPPVPRP